MREVGPRLYLWTYYTHPTGLKLSLYQDSINLYLYLNWQCHMKETSVKTLTISAINMSTQSLTLIIVVLKLNSLLWRLDAEDSFLKIILRDCLLFTIPSQVLNSIHHILDIFEKSLSKTAATSSFIIYKARFQPNGVILIL